MFLFSCQICCSILNCDQNAKNLQRKIKTFLTTVRCLLPSLKTLTSSTWSRAISILRYNIDTVSQKRGFLFWGLNTKIVIQVFFVSNLSLYTYIYINESNTLFHPFFIIHYKAISRASRADSFRTSELRTKFIPVESAKLLILITASVQPNYYLQIPLLVLINL